MKISVIIPFCNTPKDLINELIEQLSLLDNEHFEIIFVNDGSNEETSKAVEAKVGTFKYFKSDINHGVSHARNIGLKQSTGDYVFFVDSDDLLNINLVKHILNLEHDDLSIFISDIFFKEPKEYDDKIDEISTKNTLDEIYVKSDIRGIAMRSACGKLFKRDIILNNNIYFDEELPFYEDAMFVCEYYKHVEKFHLFSNIIYHYRMNEGSYSKKFNKDYMKKFSVFFDKFKNNFGDNLNYLHGLYNDTFNSVLVSKVIKAFKKFHYPLCFKICKNRCIIEASDYLLKHDLLGTKYKNNLARSITKGHNVLAANKIILHQIFGSLRLRIKRIFKR